MNPPSASGSGYLRPPADLLRVLDAPPFPSVSLNPPRTALVRVVTARYPDISELAQPVVRLAGLRFNPRTWGPHRATRIVELAVRRLDEPEFRTLSLPTGQVCQVQWSPEGRRLALTVLLTDSVGLAIVDIETGEVRMVEGVALNAILGPPVQWDTRGGLIVRLAAGRDQPPPTRPLTPRGPTIHETDGLGAPVRTYQDLLRTPHDEDLLDYYAVAQIARIDPDTLTVQILGTPSLSAECEASPDGRFYLVSKVHRPYSYLYPVSSFPRTVEVWDQVGNVITTVADLPLADRVPIEGVPTGPRGIRWIPSRPATLFWIEALDDGDPRKKVPHRDRLMTLEEPFAEGAAEIHRLEHRFAGVQCFEDQQRALVSEYDRDRRWSRTWLTSIDPKRSLTPRLIFDRSAQDRYGDPGSPLLKTMPNGERLLRTDPEGRIYLLGDGATPEGDRPFLDRLDLESRAKERLFHARPGWYEFVTGLLDDRADGMLVRRESPQEPPNYVIRRGIVEEPVTANRDPVPDLRRVHRVLGTTTRADGVGLSYTLLLPPDIPPGARLPAVFVAYPRDYTTADTASQVHASPNEFLTLRGATHLYFLLRGYAVLDDVSIPIVGERDEANDRYIEQLVASASAVLAHVPEIGPVDPERVGVMGHSYGAFMTANLLANSSLFRAGIARSGAYNRTLTPFGFQHERRTFWEAKATYDRISPFHQADKIKAPLLLIHGAEDNNPGTFTLQSERLYQAIRGTGGVARLVILPEESHSYEARQSIEHVIAEQLAWFDLYVKRT